LRNPASPTALKSALSNTSQLAQTVASYLPQIVPIKIMATPAQGGAPVAQTAHLIQALDFLMNLPDHSRASIVNISAVVKDDPTVGRKLDDYQTIGVIFVSAAGNNFQSQFENSLDTEDINHPVLPAMKSTSTATYFITVGALDSEELAANPDSSGVPAWFSQRGQRYVDLFAPGTCVRSFSADAPITKDVYYSGTSQAAPLVTFASALLLRFGVRPELVKGRLMASVDASDALADISRSGGYLNLAKALDFPDDIVVMRDRLKTPRGSYLRGTLVYVIDGQEQPPGYIRSLCKAPKDTGFRSFRRIVVGADQSKMKGVRIADPGFAYETCEFDQSIKFKLKFVDGSPPEGPFGLADVKEIVPRLR
jgi:subtilisin family serine protease